MILRLIVQNLLWLAGMAALLFVPAGEVHWPAAWVFLATLAGISTGFTIWLARTDPGLLAERMKFPISREQKPWDRVLMAFIGLFYAGWTALAGLDVQRFHGSDMPIMLQAFGLALIAACMAIVWLTFRENTFAAPVVRIQAERGQKVISTGPYALVRHPMYAGAILFLFGQPLLLGSWWAFAATPILVLAIAVRAVGEEGELSKAFPDYAGYAARVRFRLIPGIW
ncbi:MAG TPA: isoprenylcysteine carboxylmethyltransferase family protein [Caulobacteraceae bacterium]